MGDPPQIVLHDGRVHTLDGRTHGAIGLDRGRIAAIGTTEEVRAALPGADVVYLDGASVLPGITDSHTHFKRASAFLAMYIDFGSVEPASVADVCSAVAERAAVQPSGSWIQGDGLAPSELVEQRFPLRQELDAVSADHPVVLRSVGRHVVAANSRALEAAGIDAATQDPAGGRIERDDAGRPTGVLQEEAKLRLDANRSDTVIPAETEKDRIAALSRSVELLSANGIVAIHEMPRDPDQVSDWLLLREIEEPRVRVRFYIRGLAAQTSYEDVLRSGLRSGFGDEWIRLGGIKFSLDGSAAFGNAMTYEPYAGRTGDLGLQRIEEADLRDGIRRCHDGGLQIAVHAIGPRAVDMTLDAFAALGVPGSELAARRHRIEHAFLPGPEGQIERMVELGLVWSTQPAAIHAVGDAWRHQLGMDDLPGAVPIRSALAAGVPIQLNSDFPCADLNPFVGVRAAVDRRTKRGAVVDRSEGIDVETAIRLMTEAPARTAFEDSWRGRLAVGQAADVIVVDRDPFSVDVEELTEVTVLRTIVGGRLVYEA